MQDFTIQNITIFDGTGSPPYVGNISVHHGTILEPESGEYGNVIDGTGLCVAPGFIDAHTHSDFCLGSPYNSLSRVSQGITSQIAGQCGKSGVIRSREMYHELTGDLKPLPCPGYDDPVLFETFEGYLAYVNHLPMIENTAFLIGHGNLRQWVMGYEDRPATKQELCRMKEMLAEGMEAGALGMSSGLIYIPGAYARMDEIVELCKVVARYDGIYTTHMRSEGDKALEAIEESIEVARRSGCRLNISHLKICGQKNHGRAGELLARIHQGRREGVFIAVDQYPYAASSTGLDCCIPPWHFTEGPEALLNKLTDRAFRAVVTEEILTSARDFDNAWVSCGGPAGILIGDCTNTHGAKGKTIAQYAKEVNKDPLDALFDLLIENKGDVLGIYFEMAEKDVRTIIQDPTVMVGCDSAAPAPGTAGHPRSFGSFPRALGYYGRDGGVLPMETMIYKMTGLPSQVFGLKNKGSLAPGKDADLVIFNAQRVKDQAVYEHPEALAEGIEYVFIGGRLVYQGQRLTDARPGCAILRT